MLYPAEWFGHSSFGGRFTAQLKFAGWDGIVVEGASDQPVWINIVNDQVKIESAKDLWGMDTWDTQQEVMRRVLPKMRATDWSDIGGNALTQQVPAVVCCGPAGEKQSRLGALLHGPGSQAALCGFGGVFGSKKLKAISAIGTGSVPIADPQALMEARLWFRQFQWDVDNPYQGERYHGLYSLISGQPSGGNVLNREIPLVPARAAACASCPRGCRMRLASGESNESVCAGTMAINLRESAKLTRQANDLMQKLGLGHWQLMPMLNYVVALYKRGDLGKGKKIDTDLPVDQSGTMGYVDILMRKIANREGIGNDLSEGLARFAQKYGMYEKDVSDGTLPLSYWGTSDHYDSRVEAEWGFGSLLGERDLMQHMMANYPLHWMAETGDPYLNAEDAAKLLTDGMVPYQGDPFMVQL